MNGSVREKGGDGPPGLDERTTPPAVPFAQSALGLRRLAAFHAAEPTVAFLTDLRRRPLRADFSQALDRDDALQAMALVDEVVSDLPTPITEDSIAALRADFIAIHRDDRYRACPSESGWTGAEADRPPSDLSATLRRWQRHAGLTADPHQPPDHLVPQLLLLATLLETGNAPDATLFLDQHPLRWIPAFCSRVATRCREPFYAGVAILTAAQLDHLRDLLAVACGLPRPSDEDDADTRRRRWADGRLPRICACDG